MKYRINIIILSCAAHGGGGKSRPSPPRIENLKKKVKKMVRKKNVQKKFNPKNSPIVCYPSNIYHERLPCYALNFLLKRPSCYALPADLLSDCFISFCCT